MSKSKVKDEIKKSAYVYDVENYPNYFLAIFKNINTGLIKIFQVFHDYRDDKLSINDIIPLIDFIKHDILSLIGYNNLDYDDTNLKHILTNESTFTSQFTTAFQICQSLNKLSINIIAQDRFRGGPKNKYVQQLKSRRMFPSMDLMATFNTVDRVSLKQIAINMRWHNIKDLPHTPDHILIREELNDMITYCINDVEITNELRLRRIPDLQFRKDLGQLYNINFINSNDTNIAKSTIRKFYLEGTDKKWEDIKDLKTFVISLKLKTCISRKIRFCTQKYMQLYNEMMNKEIRIKVDKRGNVNIGDQTVANKIVESLKGNTEEMIKVLDQYNQRSKKEYETIIHTKLVSHTVGLGGIHSINKPREFVESSEFEYIDADVTGFYPRIIINENLYPRHLGPEFVAIYEEKIVNKRIQEKLAGNKLEDKSLKISANATFGLTKNVYSWLFDPKVATHICISGQLFLLMLIERLEELSDCKIIYSNTDGITTMVPKYAIEDYYRICNQWMRVTGFNLEFSNYRRMLIRDVNNFLIISSSGELKEKGAFLTSKNLAKTEPNKVLVRGYNYPIIAIVLEEYYTHGSNAHGEPIRNFIEDYLKTHTDFFNFMKAERTNTNKFNIILHYRYEDKIENLQKSNRWIVTKENKNEGRLIKVSKEKNKKGVITTTSMQMGKYVTIFNDTSAIKNIASIKIDYDFYIGLCNDIRNKIKRYHPEGNYEMEQIKLFS